MDLSAKKIHTCMISLFTKRLLNESTACTVHADADEREVDHHASRTQTAFYLLDIPDTPRNIRHWMLPSICCGHDGNAPAEDYHREEEESPRVPESRCHDS